MGTHGSCAGHGAVGLRREWGLERFRLRLDLAEENMSEQEMSVGGIWMVLEVLADGAVSFGELCLLEKRFGISKGDLAWEIGRASCRERERVWVVSRVITRKRLRTANRQRCRAEQ